MGWIKLDRDLFCSEFWLSEAFTDGQAWVDLIALASWRDSKYREGNEVRILKRGDVLTSYRALADRWKWSVNKVRRYIEFLQKAEMVTVKSTPFDTVLTIENYGKYQDTWHTDEHTNEYTDGTTTDTQTDTRTDTPTNTPTAQRRILLEESKNKEVKNIRIKNKETYKESGIEELDAAMRDFIKHREKLKAPPTARAIELTYAKLEQFAPDDIEKQIKILNQSIERGWKGVFNLIGNENIRRDNPNSEESDVLGGVI